MPTTSTLSDLAANPDDPVWQVTPFAASAAGDGFGTPIAPRQIDPPASTVSGSGSTAAGSPIAPLQSDPPAGTDPGSFVGNNTCNWSVCPAPTDTAPVVPHDPTLPTQIASDPHQAAGGNPVSFGTGAGYYTMPSVESTGSSSHLGLWLVIGAGVLLLALLLFTKSKKKK